MYFACVMCLFVLHATADICAWTLATWAHPIRTNFAALKGIIKLILHTNPA